MSALNIRKETLPLIFVTIAISLQLANAAKGIDF